ncbi:hypothetical protein D9M68_292770 [compost metagenome]
MPLMKIVRAHTPEAVIVAIGVFVVVVGWLIHTTFTMNATLSAVDTKLDAMDAKVDTNTEGTNQRIDRIVAVLPDVRAKVAQEEVAKPIQAAVVVTEPIEASPGKWITAVHLVEAAQQTRQTYVVQVKGPKDKTIAYLASGTAISSDADAISFDSLSTMSTDLGKSIIVPNFVISKNSIALRRLSPDFQKTFEEALRNYQPSLVEKTATVQKKTTSWEKLSAELEENAHNYEPN